MRNECINILIRGKKNASPSLEQEGELTKTLRLTQLSA